jgi:MFS family permease
MTMAARDYVPDAGAVAVQPRPMRHFLWSRLFGQTALNALLYALLIAVVERANSSLAGTLFVAAFLVPSIVLGIPGGALADALPKRPVLVLCLLARAALAVALVWVGGDLQTVYLLVLALATVGQVFGPAESAFVPALLPPTQLARGNAAMQFVLLAAQVLGAVALAPVLLKLAGADAVFVLTVPLFLIAAWQMLRVRPAAASPRPRGRRGGVRSALVAGWQAMRADATVLRALVRLTLLGTALKILVAIAPLVVRDVLGIAAANTVYVMAPAALGSVGGLLLAPPLVRLVGHDLVGRIGFVLFAAGLLGLAWVSDLGDWLVRQPRLGFQTLASVTRVPGTVSAAMLLAVLLGLAFAICSVAIRTLVHERAPTHLQGRVFATQLTIADALSLVPLLAAGAVADWVGMPPVLIGTGLVCLIAEGALRWIRPQARGAASAEGKSDA